MANLTPIYILPFLPPFSLTIMVAGRDYLVVQLPVGHLVSVSLLRTVVGSESYYLVDYYFVGQCSLEGWSRCGAGSG